MKFGPNHPIYLLVNAGVKFYSSSCLISKLCHEQIGGTKPSRIITQNEKENEMIPPKSSDARRESKSNSGIDLETSHDAVHKKSTKCPPTMGQGALLAFTQQTSQRAFKHILRKSLPIDL